MLLHVLGSALHVHHDIGDVQTSYGVEHPFVHLSARNVIDESCAVFFHTHGGHVCPECIDGNDGLGGYFADGFETFPKACHFFLCADVFRIGTRGVGTDVNHVGSFRNNLFHSVYDVGCSFLAASGIKGVGRDVQDSHDFRCRKVHQLSVDSYGTFYMSFHCFCSIYVQMYAE